jgi:hypothetical protein
MGLLYQPRVTRLWSIGVVIHMGEPECSEATLELNPVLRCDKPVADQLNYGMTVTRRLPCRDDVWVSGGIAPPLCIWALDAGEWSALCLGLCTLGEKASSFYWI